MNFGCLFQYYNIIKEVIIYSFSGAYALLMMKMMMMVVNLWAVIVTVSACIMQEIWRLNRYSQKLLRWLDWIFWGWYLSSLSINYVGMSKDVEKRLPQLYYIKMKISCDLGFIAIGVVMAT